MVGYTKQCTQCGNNFKTKSAKAGRWQMRCEQCFSEGKRTHYENRSQKMVLNAEASLRKDIDKLEAKVSDIDVLISAEISNAMQNMTDNDLFEKVNQSLNNRFDSLLLKIEEENEKFREKIQRQIMTLNNKIVRIMKEME
jgi:predicted  nucleic acid-binding Zn-ribbon protein|tara:strand:+ start:234 stop:653 length:420 start_codon:yes stop_codon:yes gene_type:complete